MSSEPAVPKGSTILVTGANGFIASHVVNQLIEAGYKVKGSVRSDEKGAVISQAIEKRHGGKDAFSYIVVEDMSTENAFHEAMKGCSGVAHVASDLTFRDDPNLVITPVVEGVQNALKAAAATPTIKRFVLTSSSLALITPVPPTAAHLDKDSWNEVASAEAWKTEGYDPATRPLHVLAASKVEGERAAWKFVEAEKPQFVFNTIVPNFNMGEILDNRQGGSSAGQIKALWEGNPQMTAMMQHFPPQYAINVKDTARLHVAALTLDDVKGERLLGLTEPFNYSRLLEAFKTVDPSKTFPPPVEGETQNAITVDMQRSTEVLRRIGVDGLTSLNESVRQLVASVS